MQMGAEPGGEIIPVGLEARESAWEFAPGSTVHHAMGMMAHFEVVP